MMVALLVAGIGFLLAGLVAIGFGIPINEFGFGNTLIVAGTVAACTGMLLLGLWTAVKELKTIARLGPGASAGSQAGPVPRHAAPEDDGVLSSRDQPAGAVAGNIAPAAQPPGSAPRQEEAAPENQADHDAPAAPAPVEAGPVVKPRRNLLFSSSSRKERERAEARTTEPSMVDPHPGSAVVPPVPEAAEAPPASFDDAWPKAERARTGVQPPRRADRSPPAARNEEQAQVTVLKSGVVDGMAYSLYSDGSIEAQMPEGMMRFASIDELRAHLDHRP